MYTSPKVRAHSGKPKEPKTPRTIDPTSDFAAEILALNGLERAFLAWLHQFIKSGEMKSKIIDGIRYYWIYYPKVIMEMRRYGCGVDQGPNPARLSDDTLEKHLRSSYKWLEKLGIAFVKLETRDFNREGRLVKGKFLYIHVDPAVIELAAQRAPLYDEIKDVNGKVVDRNYAKKQRLLAIPGVVKYAQEHGISLEGHCEGYIDDVSEDMFFDSEESSCLQATSQVAYKQVASLLVSNYKDNASIEDAQDIRAYQERTSSEVGTPENVPDTQERSGAQEDPNIIAGEYPVPVVGYNNQNGQVAIKLLGPQPEDQGPRMNGPRDETPEMTDQIDAFIFEVMSSGDEMDWARPLVDNLKYAVGNPARIRNIRAEIANLILPPPIRRAGQFRFI